MESQCIREGFLLTSSDYLMYGHFLALVSVFHRTLTLPQQRQRECLSLAVQTVNEFVSLCQLAPSHPASLAETALQGHHQAGQRQGATCSHFCSLCFFGSGCWRLICVLWVRGERSTVR